LHVGLLNLAKDDESFPPLMLGKISPSLAVEVIYITFLKNPRFESTYLKIRLVGDCISVGMFCDKYIFMVLLNFRQLKLCTWPPLLKMANVHKN